MDFNIGNTLSNLPSLKDATASVTGSIQKAADYATAGAAKLKAEAVGMLQSKGLMGKFDSVSKDLKIAERDNRYLLIDPNTSQEVAVVGNSPAVGTPASMYSDGNEDRTSQLKVTLYANPPVGNGLEDVIVLDVMPSITENRSVSYKSFTPQHHPGEIMKYESTGARDWGVSAKLISRTVEEASRNLVIINILRAWTMPFYGEGTANDGRLGSYLGAPPPIITFKAYGEKMIGPVKCVLTSYNWDFPNDIDYIQANAVDPADSSRITKVPFPVIMTITLALKESWSPAEYSGFNLTAYKNGDMEKAFAPFTARAPASSPPPSNTANASDSADGSDNRFARQEAPAEQAMWANASAARVLRQGAILPADPIWAGTDAIAQAQSKIKAVQGPAGKEWGSLP
jgi:hypothetical protein